jgi:hypothetical protein
MFMITEQQVVNGQRPTINGVRAGDEDTLERRQIAEACDAFAAFGLSLPGLEAAELADRVEAGLVILGEPVEWPLNHIHTPGTPGACGSIYTREIFMPAGTWVVSRIHKTAHPFVVLSGLVLVWTKEKGVQALAGGFMGFTTPGTRRILYIVQDTVWATFHATELQDVKAIEEALLVPHVNPLLEKQLETRNHLHE